VDEAVVVLGGMMRRLGVAAPAGARSTGDLARQRAAQLEGEWLRLGRPFDAAFLGEALRVAEGLSRPAGDSAVDGDLHSGQVLRGRRERWLAVDPVLLRGDVEYDLGRVLWTRADEMTDVGACFEAAVRAAGVARDRARDWVVFRAVDYWLWGLGRGLTEDPVRCERVVRALAG
jgi:streptomycin 6-kinase